MARIEFRDSPEHTLGVEWELALVDVETRDLVNSAAEVMSTVERAHGPQPRIHQELLRNTVELTSGICHTAEQAVGQLTDLLDLAQVAAQGVGADLYAAGTHPFAAWSAQQLTEKPRYQELISRTQWWGRQMLIWGVHVHVGVRRDQAIPVVNALLNSYPHLLALSASSPIWAGQDTGYASNRAMMFQQLPTAGLPFTFADWAGYEAYAGDLLTTGVIDQVDEIRWDIRPAPYLGTVEVRVSDGIVSLTELRSITALTHCLVVDICDRLDAGETFATLPPWHVQENKWRAARYGLAAWIILDGDNNETLLLDDLDRMLTRLRPVAARLGCVEDLARVREIPRRGAAYQRMRAIASSTGDLREVVDEVVRGIRY